MILERNNLFNVTQLEIQLRNSPLQDRIQDLKQLTYLYMLRRAAIKEIGTKLENLDDEFSIIHQHNPIHLIEERIKSPASLFEKLQRKNLDFTIESINKNILDIAGIRVITNYLDDIFRVVQVLIDQDDVKLIKRKDYINHPKANGYRSVHIVVSVPVFLSNNTHKDVPVEIQIRTVGMEMWSSLEHKLRYKNFHSKETANQHAAKLKEYSQKLYDIEVGMQQISKDIEKN
ncbi:MAG: GTP pyrophosphokinase family protein [Bombilactobacillus mellis]|uniref:GTP pyrophosphokinase n=1 Tax=Bombilactobacillus mellis TaxID=1218508 RepID=UPI001580D553|nr:GTP pyrophosphokinase family protein [Bombilactobacillus mellis]MCT6841023.1 GTP pyrophosphokinase family protein [Bombilactobacillus mellis]MCT6856922.1 GTP pyrophosphokinase family protein [Bombilactobacillus mellis]MCT6872852.1 GTP pyrophosphokinase family protein [Bombilactobacillus mellis]MCX0278889.1 GTP pyrophosphokinase family protein [Bombilactobacillus mellis]NUG67731.1 GTP pyrophosphokinase family protein [Bombilactobacillus mellis]